MNPAKDYSLDDIRGDIVHLGHLIDEVMSKLLEIDHGTLQAGNKHYIDRACAFTWVARDLAERIEEGFSEARRADKDRRPTSTTHNSGSQDIPSLYREMLAIENRYIEAQTDEEVDSSHAVYVDLQSRIIAAEPKTPRDVAIQFIADTHNGDSDVSQIFEKRAREIARLNEFVDAAQEAGHA